MSTPSTLIAAAPTLYGALKVLAQAGEIDAIKVPQLFQMSRAKHNALCYRKGALVDNDIARRTVYLAVVAATFAFTGRPGVARARLLARVDDLRLALERCVGGHIHEGAMDSSLYPHLAVAAACTKRVAIGYVPPEDAPRTFLQATKLRDKVIAKGEMVAELWRSADWLIDYLTGRA
jgi:hypothetical protein